MVSSESTADELVALGVSLTNPPREDYSETKGIKTTDIIRQSTSRDIQKTRHGIHIDIFAIVVKVVEACGVANKACQEYELSGFVGAEKKKELPQKSIIEILGIEFRETERSLPKRDGMWNLLRESKTMIHAKRWTKARLPEVLGKSVRDLLLRQEYIPSNN